MAGGVTPKQIYQALIAAGASTTQAIGIMANMISESRLDPEAIGDGGTSFGLVQQHGGQYSSLVTGNAANDAAAQINVVARNGGFAAANGATPADAAGNFSANYERCTTCQPGQTGPVSWSARVANAATVAGWVSSGKWPTSAGSAVTQAGGGTGSGQGGGSGKTDATCAWALGTINLHVTSVGGGCIIHKTTIRHIVGGLLLASGGGVLLVGAALLTAAGFQQTRAGRAVGQAAEVVPGVGGAVRVGRAYASARRPPAAKPAAAKPAAPQAGAIRRGPGRDAGQGRPDQHASRARLGPPASQQSP